MREASKTNRVRGREFLERYFRGRVLDIGAGDDLVVPWAEPFDKGHGDAQEILRYREPGSYDCVHSSHCLEHMEDVPRALEEWWALVKPGGYLIVVVPDEDLYEQGIWPSVFNSDHKATFRLGKRESWSPVSYDLGELVRALPGAEVVSAEVQDDGYDHSLRVHGVSGWGLRLLYLHRRLGHRLRDRGVAAPRLLSLLGRAFHLFGMPLDQTTGDALAQIQVVARKGRGEG